MLSCQFERAVAARSVPVFGVYGDRPPVKCNKLCTKIDAWLLVEHNAIPVRPLRQDRRSIGHPRLGHPDSPSSQPPPHQCLVFGCSWGKAKLSASAMSAAFALHSRTSEPVMPTAFSSVINHLIYHIITMLNIRFKQNKRYNG